MLLLPLAVLIGSGQTVADEPPAEAQNVCVIGQLTDEGIECPALRSEDDSLYTLAGEIGSFVVGDHVCVCGTLAEVSICMQGITIEVSLVSPGEQVCSP